MQRMNFRHFLAPRFFLFLVSLGFLAGCSKAYYETMETFGLEKRDLLVDRVEDARDAQDDASEQFTDALEQFRATVNFDGGDLEKTYDRLNREYERSVDEADEVRGRIDDVESVANDLFREWEGEIEDYSSAQLKAESQSMLRDTRGRYQELMTAMRRAEATMDPVLESFQDQVLVLKHNLNARAIGALKGELASIERDTERLVAEMQQSIAEADAFIASMK